MSSYIHKQKLLGPVCELDLPFNSKVLKAGEQNGELFIWYIFGEFNINDLETHTFHTYGTGHAIQDYDVRTREYIDTVQMDKSNLVWHVFMGI